MSQLEVQKVSALELIPNIKQNFEKTQKIVNSLDDNYYDIYLSEVEKNALTYLNKKSNDIREKISSVDNIDNITISKVFSNWGNITNVIIDEIITHITELINYNKNDQETWYNKWIIFFNNIMKTITEKDRLLYVGISVVIVSILLNFIIVSS
tara:strand:- start:397 stop:855 length:459 start_codon:yes stop_codon:yes gene_type:complete